MIWAGMLVLIAWAGPMSFVAAPLHAQAPTVARLQPPGKFVEVLDLERNSWRMVYRSPAAWMTALSVGPNGGRMALLSWTEGTTSGHDYVNPPASKLIVIDTAGQVIAPPVPQVQRYAWCGATCIVYITGQDEETHYDFRPEGLGMLEIRTGKTRVLPSPSTPIGITWASFDSATYVKNLPRPGEGFIYRLDLAALTLEPTPLKDHVFSPTGRYYLYQGEFTDTFVVYDRRTNIPVDIEPFRRGALLLGWASPREDLVLAVQRPPARKGPVGRPRPKPMGVKEPYVWYKLYDLSTHRVRQVIKGHLRDWSGPGNLRMIERDGRHYVIGASPLK